MTEGGDDADGDDEDISDALSANIDAALDLIVLHAALMLEGPPPPLAAPLPPPLRPGELSMLLWVYTIIMPRDRPTGWERPHRVERPQGGAPAGAVVGRASAVNLFVNGAV